MGAVRRFACRRFQEDHREQRLRGGDTTSVRSVQSSNEHEVHEKLHQVLAAHAQPRPWQGDLQWVFHAASNWLCLAPVASIFHEMRSLQDGWPSEGNSSWWTALIWPVRAPGVPWASAPTVTSGMVASTWFWFGTRRYSTTSGCCSGCPAKRRTWYVRAFAHF